MKNKQKAWRLGASVLHVRGRTHKAQATLIGSALREDPEQLRIVMARREILSKQDPLPRYEAPRRRSLEAS